MTTLTPRPTDRTTRPPAPWQPPTQLRELGRTGPVASVYLGTRGGVRDGADRVLARWQAMRRRLRDEGATESLLETLDECVRQAPPSGPTVDGQTVAAFAGADGRGHVEHLSRTVAEQASLGPYPHLSPLLAARHREVPVVVVLTERRGADLLLVEPGAPDLLCQVVGEDLLIRGSAPDELLARAEEQWTSDARAVGEALTWLVDCSRARLVVTGGQAGTTPLLRARLEPRTRSLLVPVRSAPDARSLTARARLMAADAAAVEEAAVVDEVLGGLSDGRACVGVSATLRAVVHGQAEEVLIAPDAADHHRVRRLVLDRPAALGGRRRAAPPVERSVRLSDVLVHAAGATSAVVRTVRDGRRLDGGVGALLRAPVDVSRPPRRRVLS
ncbi:hypothetical protein SAMN05660464_1036 [Geodermatophilus dictyosporus]|uniref:Uncharacterized protein n=1 Tax=Geodermatophilus dictyosporus TaxID=1523247 RepID=A0A1I5JTU5_9ACTN|nr:hypothetical protein [Geodermatophilus dictyosporus]SFO76197.1 hypothetical protein SAMN05660464_1036 [Geodermatophilus dictyosporus]